MSDVNRYVVSEMTGGYPHHWHAATSSKACDNPHFSVNPQEVVFDGETYATGTIAIMNGLWSPSQLDAMRNDPKCKVLEGTFEESRAQAVVIRGDWDAGMLPEVQ